MNAALLCRRITENLRSEGAFFIRNPERRLIFRRDIDERNAEPAVRQFTVRNKIVDRVFDIVDRNRKAESLRTAGLRSDPRVDADHFPVDIDKRATGVSLIDRGVGLNKIADVADIAAASAGRADNALRHRLIIAERRSHRKAEVARMHRIGITERRDGNRFIARFERNESDVHTGIGSDEFAVELPSVVELYGNLRRFAGNVIVRKHVERISRAPHDNTRSESLLFILPLSSAALIRQTEKEKR